MNILEELTGVITKILPVETAGYTDEPPDKYAVLVPISDEYAYYADNKPHIDISEVRISVFVRGNYMSEVRAVTNALIESDFSITQRRFVEYERETMLNHYVIDVQKYY